MSKELILLVDALSREKNIESDIVYESIEKALAIASRKNFVDNEIDIKVQIDRNTGKYHSVQRWLIVDNIENPSREILLEDAKNQFPQENIVVGNFITKDIENVDLGRVSAQITRNIIAQKIHEAEKEQTIKDYLSRNRGLVSGKVRKIEFGNIILNCGKINAIILQQDLIPKEVIQPGQQLRAYLDKSKIIFKGSYIQISRIHPQFLVKLLEMNVPELAAKRILIKGIARIPGVRSKIAVVSVDERLDAKSACIGFRNQRISSISSELAGEKIDIIEYNENIAQYAINAFSPAVIEKIVVNDDMKLIEVIVSDDEVGNAIGVGGLNVRLVSKLLGYVVNVLNNDDATKEQRNKHNNLLKLFTTELDLDEEIANILIAHGFSSLEEIAYVDNKELLNIKDFDIDIVDELQNRAKSALTSKTDLYQSEIEFLANDLSPIVKFSLDVILHLIEANVKNINDFADLSAEELMEIINIDMETANTLIIRSRELSGYFDNITTQ